LAASLRPSTPSAPTPTIDSHGVLADLSLLFASTDMRLKILILGGTTEGRLLGERLAGDPRYETLLSFAGRTESLQRPASAHRVGGFGGPEGLSSFLREGAFDALVDATHPFAARISSNAVRAAANSGTPLLRLARPPWQAQEGDRWREVGSMEGAAQALGSAPQRVFLTVGRTEVAAFRTAPQHDYLIRAIDDFDHGLPRGRVIAARGPFALEDELRLLQHEAVQVIVSKNAGTRATYAKLEAARTLGIEVIMVARPEVPRARETEAVEGVLGWLAALHDEARKKRGA
jgi:precorrin-6A/cobalt-precorrin-6A reductase